MGTPNPTKMERGRSAMPVGMSAASPFEYGARVVYVAAVGSSRVQHSRAFQVGFRPADADPRRGAPAALQQYYKLYHNIGQQHGDNRCNHNHNFSPTAKKFEVKFTVSLPYSKADFTADKQTKFKEAVASTAGAAVADVSLKITEARR